MWKKYCLVFFTALLLSSCSSVGKRTVPDWEVVSKDVVIEKGIDEVSRKFGEYVSTKNIGINKRGYRDWKLILYGRENYYIVYVSEDGKIVSSTIEDYK